jgi:hypothetical protein
VTPLAMLALFLMRQFRLSLERQNERAQGRVNDPGPTSDQPSTDESKEMEKC